MIFVQLINLRFLQLINLRFLQLIWCSLHVSISRFVHPLALAVVSLLCYFLLCCYIMCYFVLCCFVELFCIVLLHFSFLLSLRPPYMQQTPSFNFVLGVKASWVTWAIALSKLLPPPRLQQQHTLKQAGSSINKQCNTERKRKHFLTSLQMFRLCLTVTVLICQCVT